MAIFKCKICGGALEIDSAQSVATCEYCGTKQTLPRLDDERKANLYDRANHFRRNNDFDKAMGMYETILNEDNTDSEAYWSIVLCRYGIEYVEDPATHKRVPTVNRAQFTSIFDDEDYKSAIANADSSQRDIYEAEAAAINEIQKEILAISQNEEPFDVFICYKETDNSGRRTQDSVLATELYHELTREGFKVFFSRITLEDKLGVAYEPYIFAALHSAKVMVVLGTRPEHFNAIWVKNEWSRYLALIKNGAKKTLIPAYRDMDPYDLPEEFSHLQAQDMAKLGFMQDLIRGIKKIVESSEPNTAVKETVVTSYSGANIAPILKRVFMSLEDGEFELADSLCEQVLNQDPENSQAYLGKLMAEMRAKTKADLAMCSESFENSKSYMKANRFADSALADELKKYIVVINERNAKKAEEERKEALYKKAVIDYKSDSLERIRNAVNLFTELADYSNSQECLQLCINKIEQIQVKKENDRIKLEKRLKKAKKIAIIASLIAVAVAVVVISLCLINSNRIKTQKNNVYNEAVSFMNQGKYDESLSNFNSIIGYKDSKNKIFEIYGKFSKIIDSGNHHTVGVKLGGTAVACGSNDIYHQCDVSNWVGIVEISAGGYHTVGLKADGTVLAAGSDSATQCSVSGWTDIIAVSAGDYHTVGLKSDGTVVAVGSDYNNQCDVYDWNNIIAISAGSTHTVGLKNDGTVVAVGDNYSGQCNVSDWTDIVAISAGTYYTVGLKSDGTVVATGNNNYNQCDVYTWTDVVAISAGDSHTIGLKSDGTVVAVGYNHHGQCDVNEWTDIAAIACGDFNTVGIKFDGTAVAVGGNSSGQCDVENWEDILAP